MLPGSWPLWVRVLLGVLGAIAAGAAGSYVSEVIAASRKKVEERRARAAEVEAHRRVLVATRERAASDQSVAGLLRPERGVVDFVGREDELKRLREWCSDDGSVCPVCLVTGRGGVGKTRLGLRLAESLPFEQWECHWVRPGDEVAAVKAAGRAEQRVLLVIDYAETRVELAVMLAEVAAHEADGGRGLRVLLLARQVGEWWTALDTESDAMRALAARTPVLELAAALDDQRDDVQVIEEALPFYAAARGRPVPRVRFTVGAGVRLPVLVLHAAALVAVLDAEQGVGGGRAAADLGVLDRLIGHERRLWDKAARRVGLGVALPVLEQVIAAVVLLLDVQDSGEAAVRRVIRSVPDLAKAPEERVGALARWLRQLYSGPGGAGVDVLRPDLVAERHAVDQLVEQELLRRACFTDQRLSRAVQALTVLTRACAHHRRAPELLDEVLRHDLVGLADAAIVVAVQTGARLGDLLAGVLEDVPVGMEDLQRIAEQIPYPTVALAAADAAATRRVREILPADADPADIARWSRRLATVLAQLGRREEALEAATEAVNIRRGLAEVQPDVFLSELAGSLDTRSGCLSDLGRREEALRAIAEAVEIRRELARVRPDAFLSELAGSLDTQSGCLSDLGRREEALWTIVEAVGVYRTLAEVQPDVFLPDLAKMLSNQSNRLSDLGRRAEALQAIVEAVGVYRTLAEVQPDAYLPDLAGFLSNQSSRLSDHGRWAEALESVTEAVGIYRRLVEIRPAAFLPDLAMSLNNQSNRLSLLGRREEALRAMTEAVEIRRELARVRPDAFLPDLAMSLNNQSSRLSDLGRREEALQAIAEAVEIRRGLAEARPAAFLSNLATSLVVMGRALVDLDQIEKGTQSLIEGFMLAVDRDLAELAQVCAESLREARSRDAEGVATVWHRVTGEDLPQWLR
ncbi:tetratricopeptide repeat protein [Actinomadura litoris]|uniref:tetratricopeptide repeat protein n=1 Tax=Actinomadura litoris TaxID=2678616 RepID=UPI002342D396|nr:tetratricopeptide repeat protein [Actinomadura litoris]